MRINVSIDPGIVTCGAAIWDAAKWGSSNGMMPIDAFTFNAGHGRSRTNGHCQASLKVAEWLASRLKKYTTIDQVYCEEMEFRSTHVGIAAVNDVLGVAFSCGVIAQLARQLKAAFHPAPVSQWKGNLSKQQVARRIVKNRWFGNVPDFMSDVDRPSHDWDAVGIGLWGMGRF